MKVYFSKTTGEVTKIKKERCNKPYCNTEEYRKNMSQLNKEEEEALHQYYRDEADGLLPGQWAENYNKEIMKESGY